MILKKMINSKIAPYDKPKYSELFHKILEEISKGRIPIIETRRSTCYFNSEEKTQLWLLTMKSVEEKEDSFNKPKIVFCYLLRKARIKYQEILSFSKEEGLSPEDVIKIQVNVVHRKNILLNNPKKSLIATNLSGFKKPRADESNIILLNNEEEEDNEDNFRKKVMRNLVNRVEKTKVESKQLENSHEIKIFQGKYLKTYLVIDNTSKKPNRLIIRDSESQEYITNTQHEMTINIISPKKNIFSNIFTSPTTSKLPKIEKVDPSVSIIPKNIPSKIKKRNSSTIKIDSENNRKFFNSTSKLAVLKKTPIFIENSKYNPVSTEETTRPDKMNINLPSVKKKISPINSFKGFNSLYSVNKINRWKKVKSKPIKVDEIKILSILEKNFGVNTIEE